MRRVWVRVKVNKNVVGTDGLDTVRMVMYMNWSCPS